MTRTAKGHLVPNNQVSQGRDQSINLIEYIHLATLNEKAWFERNTEAMETMK